EMVHIADFIDSICRQPDDQEVHASVRRDVADFCTAFDVPGISDR
ncbi:serine hydroxymethyltransferase, partial [Mesorhizobium sp. M2A.F.Ca.ET.015.02.1.1]